MELGGNKHINAIFEGKHTPHDKPEPTADQETRQKYIRSKYVERKFFSPEAYAEVGKEENVASVDNPRSSMTNEFRNGFSPVNWNEFPAIDRTVATKIGPRKDQLSLSLHDNSQRTRQDFEKTGSTKTMPRKDQLSHSLHENSQRTRQGPRKDQLSLSQCEGSEGTRQVPRKDQLSIVQPEDREMLYQTFLNDESSGKGRSSATRQDCLKSFSSSRGQSGRSRSNSSGRKPSDRVKHTSSHSISSNSIAEEGDSDGHDSFVGDAEKSAEDNMESMQASAQTFDVLSNSQSSFDAEEDNLVKSSSRYRKGNRRMPRADRGGRGRGALSRAMSVPDFGARPQPRPQVRRKDEKKVAEKSNDRDDLLAKLKDVLPEESDEKLLQLLQAVQISTGSKASRSSSQSTSEPKSRSSRQANSETKSRSSGQSHSENRSRSSGRSSDRSRSRSSDKRRRRSTSRKRGIRRNGSSSDIKQKTSRSKSGDRRRRRGSSDDTSPLKEAAGEDRSAKKSSGRSPTRNLTSTRSSGSESLRKRHLPVRSKSDDLGLHFSLNEPDHSTSRIHDDGLSINTELKQSAATKVIRKSVQQETWLEDVGEFSDEDLFAGTDETLLSECEEEDDTTFQSTPSRRKTASASIPIKLMKDFGASPNMNDSKTDPRPSLDIAALTFYD